MECDIGRRKTEANITIHTPRNLEIVFTVPMIVLLLFCGIKRFCFFFSLKQRKVQCRDFQSPEVQDLGIIIR